MTARMRRLLIAGGFLAVVLAAGVALGIVAANPIVSVVLVLVAAGLVTSLSEILLVAANVVTKPAEAQIRKHYLSLARAKLARVDPLVVAVVGSFGKTSTKHILAQLLQPSVNTLPTRKSFNTLMGVSRAINEDLHPEHRVFVVEMDAYAEGEIAAISDLVHPRIAIVTAIGPQHMERFGTFDRIADAMYEVSLRCRTTAPRSCTRATTSVRGTCASCGAGAAPLHSLRPRRRCVSRGRRCCGIGDRFDAHGASVPVAMAGGETGSRGRDPAARPPPGRERQRRARRRSRPGVRVDAAITAAATLQQIEHRLELMATTGPMTVIDDSYNANPVGVHNGLEVLAAMTGGAKFLVTPGLVELGSVEDDENRRYGEHAAKVCDHVIVMSAKTSEALCAGLRDGGMPEERIHVVDSLEDATRCSSSFRNRAMSCSSPTISPTPISRPREYASDRSLRLRLGDNRPGPRAAATFHSTSQPALMHCPSSTEHAS